MGPNVYQHSATRTGTVCSSIVTVSVPPIPKNPAVPRPQLRNSESPPSPETIAHTPHGCGQMAPKKKQPASKQKQKPKSSSASSSSSSAATAAPRLQISSENERRLRRLLLNSSAASTPSPAPADGPEARGESREQKARRLRGVYDKLALEGFSSAQIEQALSAIPVRILERSSHGDDVTCSYWL